MDGIRIKIPLSFKWTMSPYPFFLLSIEFFKIEAATVLIGSTCVNHDLVGWWTFLRLAALIVFGSWCRDIPGYRWSTDPAFLFFGLCLPCPRILCLLFQFAHQHFSFLPLALGHSSVALGHCGSLRTTSPGRATLLGKPLIVFRWLLIRGSFCLFKFRVLGRIVCIGRTS